MTTPQPSNQSELQLYQVLQRANLLQYYNVFIGQGGDDVRQLCEAGEEEFLEIMALVGMASKPLHVRRLQKALQEWVTNPTLFAQNIATLTPPPPAPGSIMANIARSIAHGYCSPDNHNLSNSSWSPQALVVKNDHQRSASAPQSPTMSTGGGGDFNSGMMVIKPEPNISPQSMVLTQGNQKADPVFLTNSPAVSPNPDVSLDVIGVSESESSSDAPSTGKNVPLYYYNNMVFNSSTSSGGEERNTNSPQPMLSEAQIQTIADAAKRLAKNHPVVEPKWMNIKKSLCREIEELIAMPRDDPMQLEKMRKYGAIYGRFDSKRKNEKHMSLHEISVNEASAQLCSLIPALLTRREELFPLARQIVRDSGYQYAKGHSRSGKRPAVSLQLPSHSNDAATKKVKMEASIHPRSKMTKLEKEQAYKEARLKKIAKELSEVAARQEELRKQIEEAKLNGEYDVLPALQEELDEQNSKQINLVTAQSELSRKKRPYNRKQPVVENSPAGMFDLQALMHMGHHGEMHNGHGGLRFDFSQFNPMPLNMTGIGLKHTLLDEGLRIATQYGMVDFAAELQGLKEPPMSCMPQEIMNLSSQSIAKISRSTVTETQSVVPDTPSVVMATGESHAGDVDVQTAVSESQSAITEMPNVCPNSSVHGHGDDVHSCDVDVEDLSKTVPNNSHDVCNDSEAEVDVEDLTTKTLDDNDNNIKSQMPSLIANYSIDSHMPTPDSPTEKDPETKLDTVAMDTDLANHSDSERCYSDDESSSLQPMSPSSAAGMSRRKKPTWKMAHWLAGESG